MSQPTVDRNSYCRHHLRRKTSANPLMEFRNIVGDNVRALNSTGFHIFRKSWTQADLYSKISAIPEPAACVMMIVGLVTIGGVMRSRLRTSEVKINARFKRLSEDEAVA